uniref:Globin family profile domain-containing protein n=1 Tax=Panagrolaimus superbus TaxID=310955 RepID=A0A914YRV8_9BILA
MMRIKEAIQRRKLIQQLNDEYDEFSHSFYNDIHPKKEGKESDLTSLDITPEDQRLNNLKVFVKDLNHRLTYPQRRALRVTWKRLSEAPKTSGRGNLQIMEKRCPGKSVTTLRDHAHLLIDFIDGILNVMFDQPLTKPVWDPLSIGKLHSKLMPLGFERQIWLKLGECFAEVMFSQECIRAYPHAASAWSLLAVSCTDKMYTSGRAQRSFEAPFPKLQHSLTSMSLSCPFTSQTPTTESSASSSSARSLQPSPSKSHSEDSSTTSTSSAPPNTIRLTAASSLASFFPNNAIPFELSSSSTQHPQQMPNSSSPEAVAAPRRKLPSDPICPVTNRRHLFRVKAESFSTLH